MKIYKTVNVELEEDPDFPKEYVLDGFVTCRGLPIGGCKVSCKRSDGIDSPTVTTDTIGHYIFPEFIPGDFVMTVMPPEGYLPKMVNFTMP